MAQDAFDLMAESNLEGVIGVCLPKLLGRIDFENLMVVNQAELAKKSWECTGSTSSAASSA